MLKRRNPVGGVVLAIPEVIIRSGVSRILNPLMDEEHAVGSFSELLHILGGQRAAGPRLVVLSLHLPGLEAGHGIATLRARGITTPLLVISPIIEAQECMAAIAAGANGFVSYASSIGDLTDAANAVMAGRLHIPRADGVEEGSTFLSAAQIDAIGQRIEALTGRQRQVLSLLAEAKSNKQIARDLSLSEATVKVHNYAIFQALGVHKRMEAVALLSRLRTSQVDRRIRDRASNSIGERSR